MKTHRILLAILLLSACQVEKEDEKPQPPVPPTQDIGQISVEPRVVPTPDLDWEHIDWMPTPAGQARITTPWIGQGALDCGLEILNDRKASDGWELLYNTFDADASAPLVNPYFILYNKYRGIMRIFLYITTEFLTTSSYIEDCISVRSPMKILNFMGDDFVDASAERSSYTQLQPELMGCLKWYMMQYELAYDPSVAAMDYHRAMFDWRLKYYKVEGISLGGSQQGTISGTIGAATDHSDSSLINLFQTAGTGVLAAVGSETITKNTIDAQTGANSLGLPESIFKDIAAGVSKALTSSVSAFPSAAVKFLSGIFGGFGTTAVPISLTLQTSIRLSGAITSGGTFPSSPASVWMPGTDIASDAPGYLPSYNKPLGVFNLVRKPVLNLRYDSYGQWEQDDPFDPGRQLYVTYEYLHLPESIDFSEDLIVNPEVQRVADVSIERQDLVVIEDGKRILFNPRGTYSAVYGSTFGDRDFPDLKFGVRFTLKVVPKNGSAASILVKTFLLEERRVVRG